MNVIQCYISRYQRTFNSSTEPTSISNNRTRRKGILAINLYYAQLTNNDDLVKKYPPTPSKYFRLLEHHYKKKLMNRNHCIHILMHSQINKTKYPPNHRMFETEFPGGFLYFFFKPRLWTNQVFDKL